MTPVPEKTVGDVPEMVEVVARALANEDQGDDDNWHLYEGDARAAIAAMREPTPLMVCLGESAASSGIGKPINEEALPRVWFAMIDAALGNPLVAP
jgi:hypothetical protein